MDDKADQDSMDNTGKEEQTFLTNLTEVRKHKVESGAIETIPLSNGRSAIMRVPSGEDYREYQARLRDENGEVTDKKFEFHEEIMLSVLMVDENGARFITVEHVLNGLFNNFPLADLNKLKRKADKLVGARTEGESSKN